ncbi:hypothetical protein [Chryseobacterium daeguense]|uniref:hypothetical protein n=1 Tax=Chryseobacterium daeguense TaxID=412438 RepID=UPI0003FE72E7|nr:hypothetical protein [Chryseobacterium daeguense]
MTITGLENNYYLSQNDIWITVNGFTDDTSYMELTVTNLTTGVALLPFNPSPSTNNDFEFNICIPVRNLFPPTDHINVNSLQEFKFDFKVKFEDTNIPDEIATVTKYFVRGGREKDGIAEWHLSASHELIVGKWIDWRGISLPGYPKRIQNNTIVNYVPTPENTHILYNVANCDYRIVKFLNSLGGYQYFVFEKFQIKAKTKTGKSISKISKRLRTDNFRNTGLTVDKTIEFETKTPFQIQDVFTELVLSPEVYLYNPAGNDNESQWQLLVLENNDSIEKNYTQQYDNKIEFSFSNYVNRTL